MKRPLLLAPVGSFAALQAAIDAGADAIYFGIRGINMRSGGRADFTLEEMKELVARAHEAHVKAYLTLNTIVYDDEEEKIEDILTKAKACHVDAIIAWDAFVMKKVREHGLDLHISTQASIANSTAFHEYYEKYGNTCAVLARELRLDQIKKVIAYRDAHQLPVQVECFIHGAMCIAVSGRCFMSQIAQCKSANRGECLQMCRRSYTIKDTEEDTEFVVENNFVMSPKDMCTMDIIDSIIDAGIDVLKIEGRARSPEYVKVVVESYREAIDLHLAGKLTSEKKEELVTRMERVYNKGFSRGFYNGVPLHEWAGVYGNKATTSKQYVGKIVNYYANIGVAEIQVESYPISVGDEYYIMGETTGVLEGKMPEIISDKGPETIATQGMIVSFKVDKCRVGDKLYKIVAVKNS